MRLVLSWERFFRQGLNLICDTCASSLDCVQPRFAEPGFCCPDSQGHFFASFDPSLVGVPFGIRETSSRFDLGLCDAAERFGHRPHRFWLP